MWPFFDPRYSPGGGPLGGPLMAVGIKPPVGSPGAAARSSASPPVLRPPAENSLYRMQYDEQFVVPPQQYTAAQVSPKHAPAVFPVRAANADSSEANNLARPIATKGVPLFHTAAPLVAALDLDQVLQARLHLPAAGGAPLSHHRSVPDLDRIALNGLMAGKGSSFAPMAGRRLPLRRPGAVAGGAWMRRQLPRVFDPHEHDKYRTTQPRALPQNPVGIPKQEQDALHTGGGGNVRSTSDLPPIRSPNGGAAAAGRPPAFEAGRRGKQVSSAFVAKAMKEFEDHQRTQYGGQGGEENLMLPPLPSPNSKRVV